MKRFAMLLLLAWTSLARAQAAEDEPTAKDVEHAPLPGDESGRLDPPEQDSVLRDVAQGVLVVPRTAVAIAAAPIRGGLWMYDRHQLGDRFKQIFFDETYTMGLYPTIVYDTTYGLTGGARFVHRDLFGKREHLSLRSGIGGEFRTRARGALRSGRRFGERTNAELSGEYELRPNDSFYGIGNGANGMPAHHRQDLLRTTATVDVRIASALHLRTSGSLTDLDYKATVEAMPIDVVFDQGVLTGWPGVRNLYGELELRWDSRRATTLDAEHALFDSGWLLATYGGRIHQLGAGGDYWRYGGQFQHFWSLGAGPRAIATRLQLDAVTGTAGEVAFTQLPQLGGLTTLRGYARERFRDRIAVVGSLEYSWDIGRHLMASLFADLGRVLPTWEEPPMNPRLGYGLSLQLHGGHKYLAGLTLASSIDGGLFVNFSFDPVFEIEPRVEQR